MALNVLFAKRSCLHVDVPISSSLFTFNSISVLYLIVIPFFFSHPVATCMLCIGFHKKLHYQTWTLDKQVSDHRNRVSLSSHAYNKTVFFFFFFWLLFKHYVTATAELLYKCYWSFENV